MARPKGSLNKNIEPVQLNFEENKKFDEKTEVYMPIASEEDLEAIQKELDLARVELEKTRLEIETKKQELQSIPQTVVSAPVVKDVATAIKGNSLSDKIAERKARDSVMVTGKFINQRVKGQSVKLPYHKYGDEPVKWHPFDHGKVYTIPKGFADQINGGDETDPCYYTPHFVKNEGIITDIDDPESGIHAVDTSDKKYAFVPLNF